MLTQLTMMTVRGPLEYRGPHTSCIKHHTYDYDDDDDDDDDGGDDNGDDVDHNGDASRHAMAVCPRTTVAPCDRPLPRRDGPLVVQRATGLEVRPVISKYASCWSCKCAP